jgi:hypothetical protein
MSENLIIIGTVLFALVTIFLAGYFMNNYDKPTSYLGIKVKPILLNYKTFKENYDKNSKKYSLFSGSVFVFNNGQLEYEIYFSNIIDYYKYKIFYYKTKMLKEQRKSKMELKENTKDFLNFISKDD